MSRYIDADALKQDIDSQSPFEYGVNIEMGIDEYEHIEILSNFCPYCGAKMDGGKE